MLNYRKGKLNAFFNYSFNIVKYLTNLYAYRKYYDDNQNVYGHSSTAQLFYRAR